MRIKKRKAALFSDYKLMMVDDDEGLLDSVSAFLERNGYDIVGLANPLEGLEELKNEKYDLLILDYFMSPIKGDDFVAKLREFDRDLYVILLTGHKDLAPPLSTIKAFDIQAYCEKSSRLDQLQLLIESGIKAISQMRKIRSYRDGLDHMLTTLPEIYQLKPLDEILSSVLTHIMTLVQSEDAFILIDGLKGEEHIIYKGSGIFDVSPNDIAKTIDAELLEAISVAKTSRVSYPTEHGIVLPLVSINNLIQGVIYLAGIIEDDNKNLLKIFVNQVAASIQNAHLHSVMDRQAEELANAYSALKSSYVETIEALRLAVDTKDVYTRGHSDRVSMYARLIGARLGMTESELEDLRIGGLFHDIGKIGTSEEILLKTTKLTEEEFEEIKKHPAKGAMILSSISAFTKIKNIAGCHHERVDGRGYPGGLTENEIPFEAKIICVADAYDAMMSNRQYRPKLTQSVALEQLKKGRGTQFDQKIVDCFLSILEECPEETNMIINYR